MKLNTIFILLIVLSMVSFDSINTFAQTEDGKKKDLQAEFDSADKNKKFDWKGIWQIAFRHSPQNLEIKMQGNDKFTFEIISSNGANTGDVSGIAKIRGNKAYFNDLNSVDNEDDAYDCQILFTNKIKSINIKASEGCSSYGGVGVYFEGEYLKGEQPIKENNFVDIKVFPNAEIDNKFKKLVGEDYESFLNAFHLVNEGKDLDNLNTKVFEACVRGICPIMGGVIMFDNSGKFYAIVVDVNEADELIARYYTNNPKYVQKLPKTIENWVEDKRNFSEELILIFKNK